MSTNIQALCNESAWGDWYQLEGIWRGTALPGSPGLYRIRLVCNEQVQMAYIGQSGRSLKVRVSDLRYVYSDTMPYKAPHTAGPSLWAWRHKFPLSSFEVSVACFPDVPDALRLGLESLALAWHRQQYQVSPLCQFGRMPEGYEPSSGNDARLIKAGKRFRGGITSTFLDCHIAGIAPQGDLQGDPHALAWCGHSWTPWIPIQSLRPAREEGLYRLRVVGLNPLIFLGQGKLAERLRAIQPLEQMECSWVSNETWYPHQRLELLNDLIGAHLLSTATTPLLCRDNIVLNHTIMLCTKQ